MPNYEPYVAQLDPVRPKLMLGDLEEWGSIRQRIAHDVSGNTGTWVEVPGRKRDYICSRGDTHRRYWRRHHNGSNPIDMRCEEHEITFV